MNDNNTVPRKSDTVVLHKLDGAMLTVEQVQTKELLGKIMEEIKHRLKQTLQKMPFGENNSFNVQFVVTTDGLDQSAREEISFSTKSPSQMKREIEEDDGFWI